MNFNEEFFIHTRKTEKRLDRYVAQFNALVEKYRNEIEKELP